MKDILSQKHHVTGYFHTHAYGLTPEHTKQYQAAMKGHTTLAVERFAYSAAAGRRLKSWITRGSVPKSADIDVQGSYIARDVRRRLSIAANSPINDAFFADTPATRARKANRQEAEVDAIMEGIVSIFMNEATTPKMYANALRNWDKLAAAEAHLHIQREGDMAATIREKVRRSEKPQRIFFPVGTFHIVGLRDHFRDDPEIHFHAIVEKPQVLGFQEGIVLSHRMGRQPSEELVARGLFETIVMYALQEIGLHIQTKNMAYALSRFAKDLTACLSVDEIRALLISGKDRTDMDFMRDVMIKARSIQFERGRNRRIPAVKNAPDIFARACDMTTLAA